MADAFPGVELCDDVAPAAWLRPALRPWSRGVCVATIVPADSPAHARIFHRAQTGSGELVRWADIGAITGKPVDAFTNYGDLVGWPVEVVPQSGRSWLAPRDGSMWPDECEAVAEVLALHTTTPDDCWFCLWDGYGWTCDLLHDAAERAPRVALEHRNCLLFRGPVSAATAFRADPWFFQSPTVWWPTDRAWCVAADLDSYSTYVAATSDAVRALIHHPMLEVVECSPEQDIDHGPYAAFGQSNG